MKRQQPAFGAVPPGDYVCRRCLKPGHYIQHCPTNSDKTFDRPPPKMAINIPTAQLVQLQRPLAPGEMPLYRRDATSGDVCMVEMVADGARFDKIIRRMLSAYAFSETSETKIIPKFLICPICRGLLREAVIMSCCGISYCDACVRSALLKGDSAMSCPSCLARTDCVVYRVVPNMLARAAVSLFKRGGFLRDESESVSVQ